MDDQTRGRPRCSRLRLVTAEDLRSQLAEYEARFGVPSDRLADAFRRNGQLEEAQEFLDWSALYSAMWPRQPVPSARKPRGDVLPRWVRSLDDHWSWLAEQLDYSGGRLESESVQVQVVEDAATGERLALILALMRPPGPGWAWPTPTGPLATRGRAVLEYRAALAAFDRLGAAPDARRATEALGQEAAARPAPRQVERTFMFTDIVRSTNLVEALGDEAWGHLIRWHDEQLRAQFAAHRGEVVKAIGDGFFVAFQNPGDALACAVAIQRALAEHRRAHGFAPQVRIGVHAASATHEGLDYRGRGVNAAARVGALADSDEILATAQTAAFAPTQLVTGRRSVMLKGFAEPVEVVSIQWS